MPKTRSIKPLPPSTPDEASASVTLIGGAFMNVLLFHALHFKADARHAATTKALNIAREAINGTNLMRGTSEEWANAKALALAVIDDIEANLRDELVSRPDGESSKVN